jgi:hypothetical protein
MRRRERKKETSVRRGSSPLNGMLNVNLANVAFINAFTVTTEKSGGEFKSPGTLRLLALSQRRFLRSRSEFPGAIPVRENGKEALHDIENQVYKYHYCRSFMAVLRTQHVTIVRHGVHTLTVYSVHSFDTKKSEHAKLRVRGRVGRARKERTVKLSMSFVRRLLLRSSIMLLSKYRKEPLDSSFYWYAPRFHFYSLFVTGYSDFQRKSQRRFSTIN